MKKLTIALLLAIAFAGCKKSDTTPTDNTNNNATTAGNDGKYLTKINYWTPSTNKEATLSNLVLDANGNLTGINTFLTTGAAQYELTSVEKDGSGRITKVAGNDKIQNVAISYNFEYDQSGNISKATCVDGTQTTFYNLYTYDTSNRIATITERNGANTQTNTIHTFTYTGTSGSPSSEKEEVKNSFPQTTTTYSMEFDDKNNASQAAPKILYYMSMVDFYKNNLTKRTDGSYTSNFTYLYNSKGYPTQKKAGVDSGLKYFYEQ